MSLNEKEKHELYLKCRKIKKENPMFRYRKVARLLDVNPFKIRYWCTEQTPKWIKEKKSRREMILMISKGISINKITKKLNIPKSTVYYYYRKIKGRKIKTINIKNDVESIGEFIGLFAGDGNFFKDKNYHYRVSLYFNSKSEEGLKNEVKEMLTILFNKKPNDNLRCDGIFILSYSSKQIYLLLKKYLTWQINKKKTYSICLKYKKITKKFKIGFLRGNLDSDGYLTKNKINFDSSSFKLIKDIMSFLKDLSINYTYSKVLDKRPNRAIMHHITVKDRGKFLELIKPRKLKYINA